MTGADVAGERRWVRETLPKVSRTFALCIRLLPDGLEHPVAVAYLLCRIADTIEDSATLSAARKRTLLDEFRAALAARTSTAGLQAEFAGATTDDARLTRECELALEAFRRLPGAQQDAIRPHVDEMCRGMAEFAEARAGAGALFSLPDLPALDRYCYYVAGTVGHLLTALFALHDRGIDPARRERLTGLATSFGLGLQLTNIIKDVTVDRARGWSFVPADLCRQVGIAPEELEHAERRGEAMAVMGVLIAKARQHLDDALAYVTTLPRTAYGIRMFCLIAVYLAIRTLRLAERDTRLLDRAHKLKITRGEVQRTLAVTSVVAPSNLLV
ncbi:MAG TPA: phytoene/squalene synthase family protein, partial [Gemmatimonadales bacterium]|nr:phytoene/squalene synthase family protein [Gemmatimonadales bacterium]